MTYSDLETSWLVVWCYMITWNLTIPVEIKYYIVVFDLVGCSSLNHDLHRKNITDSPRCICNAAETCSHFLLNCPLYVNQRHHHLNNIPCALTLIIFSTEMNTWLLNKIRIYFCVSNDIKLQQHCPSQHCPSQHCPSQHCPSQHCPHNIVPHNIVPHNIVPHNIIIQLVNLICSWSYDYS